MAPRSTHQRQLGVERILLEQRVRHRHQEEVEVEALEEARDHPGHVDAGPDRADLAALLQLRKRAVAAAGVELVEAGLHAFLVP